MTMPFGKYKGVPLSDIPDEYLDWLRTRDDLRDPLLSALNEELARRQRSRPDPHVVEDIIARGQRSLARTAHPDVSGGSHEAMLAVRSAADWLYEQARSLRCLP